MEHICLREKRGIPWAFHPSRPELRASASFTESKHFTEEGKERRRSPADKFPAVSSGHLATQMWGNGVEEEAAAEGKHFNSSPKLPPILLPAPSATHQA